MSTIQVAECEPECAAHFSRRSQVLSTPPGEKRSVGCPQDDWSGEGQSNDFSKTYSGVVSEASGNEQSELAKEFCLH